MTPEDPGVGGMITAEGTNLDSTASAGAGSGGKILRGWSAGASMNGTGPRITGHWGRITPPASVTGSGAGALSPAAGCTRGVMISGSSAFSRYKTVSICEGFAGGGAISPGSGRARFLATPIGVASGRAEANCSSAGMTVGGIAGRPAGSVTTGVPGRYGSIAVCGESEEQAGRNSVPAARPE